MDTNIKSIKAILAEKRFKSVLEVYQTLRANNNVILLDKTYSLLLDSASNQVVVKNLTDDQTVPICYVQPCKAAVSKDGKCTYHFNGFVGHATAKNPGEYVVSDNNDDFTTELANVGELFDKLEQSAQFAGDDDLQTKIKRFLLLQEFKTYQDETIKMWIYEKAPKNVRISDRKTGRGFFLCNKYDQCKHVGTILRWYTETTSRAVRPIYYCKEHDHPESKTSPSAGTVKDLMSLKRVALQELGNRANPNERFDLTSMRHWINTLAFIGNQGTEGITVKFGHVVVIAKYSEKLGLRCGYTKPERSCLAPMCLANVQRKQKPKGTLGYFLCNRHGNLEHCIKMLYDNNLLQR